MHRLGCWTAVPVARAEAGSGGGEAHSTLAARCLDPQACLPPAVHPPRPLRLSTHLAHCLFYIGLGLSTCVMGIK